MEETINTQSGHDAQYTAQTARLNAAIAADTEAVREARRETDAERFRRIYGESRTAPRIPDADRDALGSWLIAGAAAVAFLIGASFWANENRGTGTASSASQPAVTRQVTPASDTGVVR